MITRTSFATDLPADALLATGRMEDWQHHLSEEEMDDHLLGDLSPVGAAHLAACALCTQRVSEAAAPIESFRSVAMAWSERRSATMPLPAVPAQGLVWQRRMGWAMATGILAVGIAMTGVNRGAGMLAVPVSSTQTNEATPAAPAKMVAVLAPQATDRSAESHFSADNRMLKAIDHELDASVESPATLGLDPVSEEQPRHQAGPVSVED